MPRYEVRLEDPNSEEFRSTSLVADDEAAARAWCEERERRMVAFQVSDEELAELHKLRDADATVAEESPDAEPKLRGSPKARLLTHEQAEPYEVVSVREA